jgi:subtilisin-like proprotein convertase family protein
MKTALMCGCAALVCTTAFTAAPPSPRTLEIAIRNADRTLMTDWEVSAGLGTEFTKAQIQPNGTYLAEDVGAKIGIELQHADFGVHLVELALPGTADLRANIHFSNGVPQTTLSAPSAPLVEVCLPGELLIQQLPNQVNGIFSDANCDFCGNPQVLADQVVVTDPSTVELIRIWGGYFPNDIPVFADFRVIIHDDAGGFPGAVVYDELMAPSAVQTGVILFGVNEWEVELTPIPAIDLGPGTWFFEIFTDTGPGTDDWFWELGDLDPSSGIIGQAFAFEAPGVVWNYDGAQDMAMELVCGSGGPGACCLDEFTCLDGLLAEDCIALGGIFQGGGTDCATVDCSTPTGACCMPDFSCVDGTTATECADLGGTYQGDGTDCANVNCAEPACGVPGTGDCCEANGTPFCDDLECCELICSDDSFCCTTSWDSICAGAAATDCPSCGAVPGACCLPDFSCIVVTEGQCGAAGGVYQGDGTSCADVDCGPPANDLCKNAIGPLAVPSQTNGSTAAATIDAAPFCGTSVTAPGVWYTVIGTGTTMTATTCGPLFGYDTKLSVYCGGCDVLECLSGNDDDCVGGASGLLSTVEWCSQEGAEYLILVHGFSSNSGVFELFLSENGIPCTPTVECIPAVPTGGCCQCDGSEQFCTIETGEDCLALGGLYLGDDSSCAAGGADETYTSNPNLPIPDDAAPDGVSDTINVADSFTVLDIKVAVVIDHTWVGDLCVLLSKDGGPELPLIQRIDNDSGLVCDGVGCCGCSSDNLDCTLWDGAADAINDQCGWGGSALTGMCSSESFNLSTFAGGESAGAWTIKVNDSVGADTGTLVSWSLILTGEASGLTPCEEAYPNQCEILGKMDIKPGSCPNSFNRNSNGVLPIALVGTADIPAIDVEIVSLSLSRADGIGGSVSAIAGPPGPNPVLDDVATPFDGELCDCHEMGGDGIMDVMMHFDSNEVVDALELGDLPAGALVELSLTGNLVDGTTFQANDCVRLVPPGTPPGALLVGSNLGGVWVVVSPLDEQLDAGGFTSFNRSYPQSSVVTITAPQVPVRHPDFELAAWFINGVKHTGLGQTIEVTVEGDITSVALLYVEGPVFGTPQRRPAPVSH